MLEILSDQVGGLEKSKSDWEALAREMLATITLEGNKEVFASLPENWHSAVSAWVNRFHLIEAAEQSFAADGAASCQCETYYTIAMHPVCGLCGRPRR